MPLRAVVVASVLLVASTRLQSQDSRPLRGMTVDDVLSIETIGDVVPSPDGGLAAVVIRRPRNEGGFAGRTRLGGDDRADVWVVSSEDGARRRITDGASDHAGFWGPSWSPDGARLVMLSTRGDSDVGLWIWTRATGALDRASDAGVHLGAPIDAAGVPGFGFAWIDSATLLAVLVPRGFRPLDYGEGDEAQTVAARAWRKMRDGLEPSASVIESGGSSPGFAATATVAVIDVVRRTTTPVAEVGAALLSAPQVSLAPGGRRCAVFETGPIPPPRPGKAMSFADRGPVRAGIVDLGGALGAPRWIDGPAHPSPASFRWSPDGARVALLVPREPGGDDDALAVLDADGGALRRLGGDARRVSGFEWLDAATLLVRATADGGAQSRPSRSDWFITGVDGSSENITAGLAAAPVSAIADGSDIVVLDGAGVLWRAAAGRESRRLEPPPGVTPKAPVARIARASASGTSEFLFEAAAGDSSAGLRVLLNGDKASVEVLAPPTPHAKLSAHWAAERTAIWRASEDAGLFAWSTSLAAGRTTRLAALNGRLADVAPAGRRLLEYRGVDGQTLNALVLLPPRFDPTKRHPALVWVYAGDVMRSLRSQSHLTDKFHDGPWNFMPLLGRGYVVLLPSMPLGPEGVPGDPMIDLSKGVTPAVDKLIDAGIADPERLAVAGHSFGGYSVFSLIAFTHRFKAAIAAAGPSDLTAIHGAFDARFRYGESALEGRSQLRWVEGGQGSMGGPPLDHLWRYLRNSPVLFADRVRTPVLILHGDVDFVPLTQAEAFFTALQRQGKPARFVRYWGEGHTVESPANIRHMWREIFDWLDARLAPRSASAAGR